MKIAIISDIHSNLDALMSVSEDIEKEKVDQIWCLGDIVGYGAYPEECILWVRKNTSIAILGNHELGVLGMVDLSLLNNYAKQSIEWTKNAISDTSIDFLSSLPLYAELDNIYLVHDNPETPGSMEYITTQAMASRVMLNQKRQVCFFGHTHIPCVYRLTSAGAEYIKSDSVKLSGSRYLANPGSVGQPRDRNKNASYIVLNDDVVLFKRVDYDVKSAAKSIIKAGLPEFLAARLFLGV